MSAPVFKRIAEAALRYLGVGPTLNAPPPVLVARHDPSDDAASVTPQRRAVQAATASSSSARSGLMPDLRGLSAREALRTLSQLGMTARMTGDGFVVDADARTPGDALGARRRLRRCTLGPASAGARPGGAPQ